MPRQPTPMPKLAIFPTSPPTTCWPSPTWADEFEPAKRFGELLAGEPEGYRSAYDTVLACCEEGASKAAIEAALAGHPALAFPKQVYPGYFISKLETVDGISWDGVWRTTEAGQRMRALLA